MASKRIRSDDEVVVSRAIEAAIRIGLIALLVFWVGQIVAPFLSPVLWGIIIAVAAHPAYRWLLERLGGRRGLAAACFTVLALLILITPTVWLTAALVEWGEGFARYIAAGGLEVPPPPKAIAGWPIVGEQLYGFWSLASSNLADALGAAEAQLKAVGAWLLSALASAGMGVVQFFFSIVIAGLVLANGESLASFNRRLFMRLAPDSGEAFAQLAERTVRSVATGVVGVAVIQSVLAAVGFVAAGVPAAAFWALACLLLGIVQLPLGIVVLPAIAYVWFTSSTLAAVLFTLWSAPVMLADNFLKPLLLGRGVETPMLVIFLGAIGGFVASGIIGLFVGAVVLVLAFELFRGWLDADREAEPPDASPAGTPAS